MGKISPRRVVAIIIFGLGILVMTSGWAAHIGAFAPKGFTLRMQQVYKYEGGDWVERGTIVRYGWADGSWREIAPGEQREVFSVPGEGVYARRMGGSGKADFLSNAPSGIVRTSLDALRANRDFVREEQVLGVNTAVIRINLPDGSGYTELYRAPALQGAVIKYVNVSPGLMEVSEPVSVEFEEPDTSLRPQRPNPSSVSYDFYRQKKQL